MAKVLPSTAIEEEEEEEDLSSRVETKGAAHKNNNTVKSIRIVCVCRV